MRISDWSSDVCSSDLLVIGTAVYAAYIHPDPHRDRVARWFLLGGGVALPVAVLTALLVYGLLLMGSLRSEGEGLRLAVTGEQWWWRVSYSPEGGGDVVHSANEIRLPAGRDRKSTRLNSSH